jgi:hypothetical protein
MENNITQASVMYCQTQILEPIQGVLERSFTITYFKTLEESYQSFQRSFYNGETIDLQTIGRKNLCPITSDEWFLDRFHDPALSVGVDLPVLIGREGASRRAFIIGEDPLRKKEHHHGDIVLSTPYALHDPHFRKGPGLLYWDLSFWLMDRGFGIYYTDIKKVWVKDHAGKVNHGEKLAIPADLYEHFRESLIQEIKEFNPEVIITFGKDAHHSIAEMDLARKVVSFIHPTFTASRHWRTQYGIRPASRANKLNYMKEQLKNHKLYS